LWNLIPIFFWTIFEYFMPFSSAFPTLLSPKSARMPPSSLPQIFPDRHQIRVTSHSSAFILSPTFKDLLLNAPGETERCGVLFNPTDRSPLGRRFRPFPSTPDSDSFSLNFFLPGGSRIHPSPPLRPALLPNIFVTMFCCIISVRYVFRPSRPLSLD